MKKILKKAFTKQIIWGLYVPLLVVIVGIILERSIPEINIMKILWDGAINILNQKIPIFVIIILLLLAFLLFSLRKRKLNEEHKFVLSMVNGRELGIKTLFIAYKKKYPNTSRIMSRCIHTISKLENLKLVKLGAFTGGMKDVQDELFQITDKGRKRIRKMDTVIKAEAENIFEDIFYKKDEVKGTSDKSKHLEPKKEMVFILKELANQLDQKGNKSILRGYYFGKFKNKETSDFNYVWSILERRRFISQERGSTGYGGGYGTLLFYITDEGLKFYHENKSILKD